VSIDFTFRPTATTGFAVASGGGGSSDEPDRSIVEVYTRRSVVERGLELEAQVNKSLFDTSGKLQLNSESESLTSSSQNMRRTIEFEFRYV
jgi:hypothetical protein